MILQFNNRAILQKRLKNRQVTIQQPSNSTTIQQLNKVEQLKNAASKKSTSRQLAISTKQCSEQFSYIFSSEQFSVPFRSAA